MTDALIEFVRNNAEWAWLVVMLVAFGESLVVIGLLVPGWVMLLALGGLVGADVLSFYPVVFSAWLGAVLGEALSFYLGRHYHHAILSLKVVLRHQKLVDLAHDFFQKHGIAGVFIGRFFGPTRAFVPFIAGVSEMSPKKFFWVNSISAIFWAPAYLIPGILVGAAVSVDKSASQMILFLLTIISLWIWWSFTQTKKWFYPLRLPIPYPQKLQIALQWSIAVALIIIFMRSPYASLLWKILSETAQRI